jgi:hypothetical protein
MPGKRHSVQDPAKRPTREGVIHCTEQVRGKTVKSISVSGVSGGQA